MKLMKYNTKLIIIIIEEDGNRWTLPNHWPFKCTNREAFADAGRETHIALFGTFCKWWI
jgi:hypothetical protein